MTQSKRDGTPYERHADVEAEIGRALGDDPATWPELAARPVGSSGGLSSEAIVFLIRSLRAAGREGVVGRLVEELSRRISRIVTKSAQGFDPATTEEIVSQVNLDVITLVLAETPSRQSEFLEAVFGGAVKRRALNEVERRKHHPRAAQIAGAATDPENPEAGRLDPVEALEDGRPGPDEIAMDAEARGLAMERVREGLAAIRDPRHREAVVLRYLQDWPITSDDDPATPHLTAHFRVSARQITNWMKTAFAEMRRALGEAHEQ